MKDGTYCVPEVLYLTKAALNMLQATALCWLDR